MEEIIRIEKPLEHYLTTSGTGIAKGFYRSNKSLFKVNDSYPSRQLVVNLSVNGQPAGEYFVLIEYIGTENNYFFGIICDKSWKCYKPLFESDEHITITFYPFTYCNEYAGKFIAIGPWRQPTPDDPLS